MSDLKKAGLFLFSVMAVIGFLGSVGYLFYYDQPFISICLIITMPVCAYFTYKKLW